MNKILHFAIRLIEFTSAWRIAATLFYNWIRLAASSGCCSLHLNVFCECLWTPNSFFLHASIAYRNSTTQLISLIFYQYNPRFPNLVPFLFQLIIVLFVSVVKYSSRVLYLTFSVMFLTVRQEMMVIYLDLKICLFFALRKAKDRQ